MQMLCKLPRDFSIKSIYREIKQCARRCNGYKASPRAAPPIYNFLRAKVNKSGNQLFYQ